MGLHVHTLGDISNTKINDRDYFIYLLDYGWKEPLSEVLMKNFDKMAIESAQNSAVTITGPVGHFANDVFSWHHINKIDGEEVLPAILITNKHPNYFYKLESNFSMESLYEQDESGEMKLILIPLKDHCQSNTDVVNLIQKVFENIKAKKELNDFSILKELKKNNVHSNQYFDTLILQPNFFGMGLNLNNVISKFLNK